MLDTRSPNNRRVMLILSESRDRGSKSKLSDVIETGAARGRGGVCGDLFGAGFDVFVESF